MSHAFSAAHARFFLAMFPAMAAVWALVVVMETMLRDGELIDDFQNLRWRPVKVHLHFLPDRTAAPAVYHNDRVTRQRLRPITPLVLLERVSLPSDWGRVRDEPPFEGCLLWCVRYPRRFVSVSAEPAQSPWASRANTSEVDLYCDVYFGVDALGNAFDVSAKCENSELDSAAMAAVRNVEFWPATDGFGRAAIQQDTFWRLTFPANASPPRP